MKARTMRAKPSTRLQKRIARVLVDAIDQGLRQNLDEISPRLYVDVRTMPSFELGLKFKAALRDVLYERRRDRKRRMAAREIKEET